MLIITVLWATTVTGMEYCVGYTTVFGKTVYIRGGQTFSAEGHIENFSATGCRSYIWSAS